MPQPERSIDLPKNILTDSDNRDQLQQEYGQMSLSILIELKESYPDLPSDLLTVGDNWMQLVESRAEPKDALEAAMHIEGVSVYGSIWPIMDRFENETAQHLLNYVLKGEEEGMIDPRIRSAIAVLDRTSFAFPLFDAERITSEEETPWGRIVHVEGLPMAIYHIRKGFSRKKYHDLGGGSDDRGWSFVERE